MPTSGKNNRPQGTRYESGQGRSENRGSIQKNFSGQAPRDRGKKRFVLLWTKIITQCFVSQRIISYFVTQLVGVGHYNSGPPTPPA